MMYLFYIGTAKALVFSCFCNIGFKFVALKSATRRAFPGRRQTQMEMGGLDSDGRKFKNAEEMWREEVGDGDSQKKSQWYNKGIKYWQVRPFYFHQSVLPRCYMPFNSLLVCEGRGSHNGWSAGWIWACECGRYKGK